jgi:hypothetical protein
MPRLGNLGQRTSAFPNFGIEAPLRLLNRLGFDDQVHVAVALQG